MTLMTFLAVGFQAVVNSKPIVDGIDGIGVVDLNVLMENLEKMNLFFPREE